MQIGDHVVTPRIGYTHHGLYIGDNEVIHYSGFSVDMSTEGEIEITSIDEFSQGKGVDIKEHLVRTYSREESVERAYKRLGENWYNVLINNCEHFVTWCITGFHSSSQVNALISSVVLAKRGTEIPTVAAALESLTGKTLDDVVKKRIISAALGSSATNIASGSGAAGTVASSIAGVSAGVATGAAVTTSATTGVVAGLAAGGATLAAAPVAAGVAVAAGVGYGVKKLWDFFTD